MSNSPPSLHVYAREINQQDRTSLSVLSELVRPGALVLDLGCGNGALGRHLKSQRGCCIDGVTLNEREAELARPDYRRVEVANLDDCELRRLFAGQRYDHIICADVLEHLRQPERVLAACRELLAESGQVLISIPNAAYAGLIAELMEGEFRYREEGLLDSTHLRFFTRQSLVRFLGQNDWGIETLETIVRTLPASEFKTCFDRLPPAVARHLLALPDALTYQFIATARPDRPHASLATPSDEPAQALFSACLYLGDADGYQEDRKIEATGRIGTELQTLSFELPPGQPITRLRLDPADRPGFLHLHQLCLRDTAGQPLWQWLDGRDSRSVLEQGRHSGLLLGGPQAHTSTVALLYTDDPWLELPVGAAELATASHLEVSLGWPMSADYLAMTEHTRLAVDAHERETQLLRQRLESCEHALHQRVEESERAERQAQRQAQSLRERSFDLQNQNLALLNLKTKLLRENETLGRQNQDLQTQSQQLYAYLRGMEQSLAFRLTRPLGWLKRRLKRTLGRQAPVHAAASATPPTPASEAQTLRAAPLRRTVDIIVPVYRGLEDTQRCLQSVLAWPQQTPWRLVVVNDCSPEPALSDWLRELASREPRMLLLENPQNLGFVATVNRAMALPDGHDVLLLNSDTEVANDWLDRLVRHADLGQRVGSITPFSNNATICSYPRFCEPNELPTGYDTARLDALFARECAGQAIDIPTGIGFCMYISRACLQEVGLFDVANFGKGYGEENDFCCRATRAGWRHLHALDTFVLHTGGVSFGDSKNARELAAMQTLRRLHPDYETAVHDFLGRDPARPARQAVDRLRILASGLPVLVSVLHKRAGGTLRHAKELAEHLQGHAICLQLAPESEQELRLSWPAAGEGLSIRFLVPQELPRLIDALRWLNVCHLHYHHVLDHDPAILELPRRLGLSYDFTAHDYYSLCPQISLTDAQGSYCGEQGPAQCASCLQKTPAPGGVDIAQWRKGFQPFLANARYVLAPSRDAAARLIRYAPTAQVRAVPHTDLPQGEVLPLPVPLPLDVTRPLKVVVLGALSQIKGADVLEAVALEAARRDLPLEFHLLGYAYRTLPTQPRARLTVHGAYAEEDLPALLKWLAPDLVWFPAQWPETYSYTLSAALRAGLPVLAPDLGAFPERLQGRPWSWLQDCPATAEQWLEQMLQLREQAFIDGCPPHRPLPSMDLNELDDPAKFYLHDYLKGLGEPALPNAPNLLAEYESHRQTRSTD